jgi:hypothetical protein
MAGLHLCGAFAIQREAVVYKCDHETSVSESVMAKVNSLESGNVFKYKYVDEL